MADSLPTPADSPQVEPASTSTSTEDHLAQGIRYLALSKYAQASESFSYAVEDLTEKNGELSIENVDALVLYGKALLGNAIEQSAVLGGNAVPQGTSATPIESVNPNGATSSTNANATAGPSNAAFHFGGDAEDEEDEEEGEGEREGEDGEEEEKEDDFEAAFVALDMARRIIEVEVERLEREMKEVKAEDGAKEGKEAKEKEKVVRQEKLAEIHRLLGDVSTESEHFDEAVEEYSSALSILTKIRPPSDRQLSEQHMLIALALEFAPGNPIERAVSHAEKAKGVLVLKLGELERKEEAEKTDKDKKEIENLKELIVDVSNKIEDLKTVPEQPTVSAADRALEDFLRQATGVGANPSAPVNDLNSLVKKKKKPTPTATEASTPKEAAETVKAEEVEEEGKGKRKADAEVVEGPDEKKPKVSTEDSTTA
ncbi:hypothetical protein JCM16303_005246 [Sporobolomyces ruberrimus]